MKIFDFFFNYMGKRVRGGAGIFDKLDPEPEKIDRLRNTVVNFSKVGYGSTTL
jgi:hypothetical protein